MTFKLPPLPKRPSPKQAIGRTPARRSRTPVECTIEYGVGTNEEDREQDCVTATCSECDHSERSWGQGERSIRRCLVLMGENCPEDADNFYIIGD